MRISQMPVAVGLAAIAVFAGGLRLAGAPPQRPGAGASLFAGLSWRSIGPVNTSGRIDDFAVARTAGRPDAIYVATASGGVFKSTNAGTSWAPVFDAVDAMMSIGDVTVAPSSPDIVWVGTGEANNRQSSSWGDGVYKSTDAGETWQSLGLSDTRQIARIVVDPANPEIVYVAAVGHLWGPNPERGVFKTADGGRTWKKVLYVDENTGATDLVMDPQHPQTLIASTYQRQRREWGFNGGGPGSGLYKTTDAGATWTKLTAGLPAGDKGRIGLDVFQADSRVVYATIQAGGRGARQGGRGARGAAGGRAGGAGRGGRGAVGGQNAPLSGQGGLYRSLDGGNTWEQVSNLNPRPMYYSQVRIDPKDRNRIYLLGSNRGFYFSDDGGRTFQDRGPSGVHGEDHALWIDPANTNHLIIGGDGGVSISWDRGLTWDFRANMPIGQFYEIGVDQQVPYRVCGGLQDNGEWCMPSAVRDRNGISNVDAWNIGGGDGFYVKFDPTDKNFAYTESQNGNASRVDLRTMARQSIRPRAQGLRWNWDTPIVISSADPHVIYMGANMVFRSPDRGETWKAISPDLSAGIDPNTLEMMGARVPPDALSRNDGSSPYGSITSISESPFDARVLYVGVDDGTVQMTRNGGAAWTNLTGKFPHLPPHTYVSTVEASRYAAGRVYATFDGHYSDDYHPYVYVSEDFGQTWESISAGLPDTSVNRIRELPYNPDGLILAHERGVHVSNDGGRTWIALSRTTNLPNVPVDDAAVQARDNALVIGTHGRGIWILDDAGPLEAFTPDAMREPAVLAPIAPAYELVMHNPQAWFGTGMFFAPNPEPGAGINYYLRDGVQGDVEITISDPYGNPVRTLKGPGARGVNHVQWDLRGEPPPPPPPGTPQPARGRGGFGRGRGGVPLGPLVRPGPYVVTVAVPGLSQPLRLPMTVQADPLAGGGRQ